MTSAGSPAGITAPLSLATCALLVLALAGCSTAPVQTFPDADADSAPQQTVWDVGAGAVRHALRMVGVPYRFGGSTPDGFDCSGLVQYSYALAGMQLPRDMGGLLATSRSVSRAQVRPGDLLFFHLNGTRNSHVALYVGNGRFVHAPSTGKFVSTASLSNPFWRRNLAGARRLLTED